MENHPHRVLALIVDYYSAADAAVLSLQLARSIQDHPEITLQIVHIDNGNSPPSELTRDQASAGVRLLSTGKNLGYAGALNYAVRTHIQEGTSFDSYWFLNSDLEIEPDALPLLVSVLRQHPRVGAAGPVVRIFSDRKKIWGARGVVSPWLGTTSMTSWELGGRLPQWSYIPGCSLLVRSQAYEEGGALPERYKLYYEETEFCIRLQKNNWDLWVETASTVYHKVDSMKGRIPARHFAYYFTRNNLSFWKACFGIPVLLQFPRTLYVIFREVLLPLRRAQNWAEFLDRFKYTAAGLIDGFFFAFGFTSHFEKKLFK